MKRLRKQKIRVIRQKDPEMFEQAFNNLTDELGTFNLETTIDINNDCFTAIFQYVEETLIPQTAKEELEAQGLHFCCENCPRFEPMLNNDGSIRQSAKRGSCFLKEYTCRDSHVCEWFCKQFLKDAIKVNKEGLK